VKCAEADRSGDQWGYAWSAAFRDISTLIRQQAGADIGCQSQQNAFGNEKGLAIPVHDDLVR
jgi:hypothetical protein